MNGIFDAEQRWLMRTYKRAPVEFVRGEGARLWDAEGREYLDFLAGISVCSVGHCHPAVVEAVSDQAARLTHVSNLYYSAPMVELAERLAAGSLGGRVFFANSGTEANECAIKIARKHAHGRGVKSPQIVSFERDFHGRTYGSLAATPGLAANEALGPMLPGFRSVPFDQPDALRSAVGEDTAAVLIETIQGEAGVNPLSEETLIAAREACDAAGALLIIDEIQTGCGRTGSLWSYEQTPVRPDVITSAKALGGGYPIGACITNEAAGDVLEPGDHGSTFAGGPVAARAALATLGIIDEPALLREVRRVGGLLRDALLGIEGIQNVRGRGLMLGVELSEPFEAAQVAAGLLERGLIVNAPEPRTLRLLPPLIIGEAEVAEAAEKIVAELEAGAP